MTVQLSPCIEFSEGRVYIVTEGSEAWVRAHFRFRIMLLVFSLSRRCLIVALLTRSMYVEVSTRRQGTDETRCHDTAVEGFSKARHRIYTYHSSARYLVWRVAYGK